MKNEAIESKNFNNNSEKISLWEEFKIQSMLEILYAIVICMLPF